MRPLDLLVSYRDLGLDILENFTVRRKCIFTFLLVKFAL